MSILQKTVGDVKYGQITPNTFLDPNNKNCYYQVDEEWMAKEGIRSVGNALYKDENDNVYSWSDLRVVHKCDIKKEYAINSDGSDPSGDAAKATYGPGSNPAIPGFQIGNTPGGYIPSSANQLHFPDGRITDKSAILSTGGITSKVVLDKSNMLGSRVEVTKKNSSTSDINGQFNNPGYQDSSIKDRVKSFEYANDGCDRHSYFYLKDFHGNDPDDATLEYFLYMNDRSGNIFQLCRDGKVLLRKEPTNGMELSPGSVHSNEIVSYLLALTIDNAIKGGVGEFPGGNHASRPHRVNLKVYDPYRDPKNNTIEKRRDADNQCYYEKFNNVSVDLSDYRNCLTYIPLASNNNDNIPYSNEIIQAAFIGHFICELFSCSALQEYNSLIPDNLFVKYHNYGIDREIDIIDDMTSKDIIGRSVPFYAVFDDNKKAYKYSYYPLRTQGAFVIRHYFPVIDGEKTDKYNKCILGANITLIENFIIPDDMKYEYKKNS